MTLNTSLNRNDQGFLEFLETIRNESRENPSEFESIVLESITESFKMAFGDEITSILLDILKIPKQKDKASINLGIFAEKLDMTFGEDAKHIKSMIKGKVLLKYHHRELMKKIALPFLFYS